MHAMHDAPDTPPPGTATATAANAVARQSLFLGFFGFMLVTYGLMFAIQANRNSGVGVVLMLVVVVVAYLSLYFQRIVSPHQPILLKSLPNATGLDPP